MRQYINISPYCDILGSDTVRINTHLDISNIMIIYIKSVVMCDIHIYRDINDGNMKFSFIITL